MQDYCVSSVLPYEQQASNHCVNPSPLCITPEPQASILAKPPCYPTSRRRVPSLLIRVLCV